MKVTFEGKDVIELSEIQKKVIQNDIPSDIFESDMARRLHWCLDHPCRRHCDRMKPEWTKEAKARGAASIPVDPMKIPSQFVDMTPYKEYAVQVDGKECFRLSKEHHAILANSIVKGRPVEDYMSDRMKWILSEKYARCMERLRREWEPKLAAKGMDSVPSDDDEFAQLVFSLPEYKNRSQREQEAEQARLHP